MRRRTGQRGRPDYAAVSGTVDVPPGVTSQDVTVAVLGDCADEDDETFTVGLSGEAGGTITRPTGQGTITDNDNSPEPDDWQCDRDRENGGGQRRSFTVNLSPQRQDSYRRLCDCRRHRDDASGLHGRDGTVTLRAGNDVADVSIVDPGRSRWTRPPNVHVR